MTNTLTSSIVQHADNAKAMVVLAHGAGADKSHAFMTKIADGLVANSISVCRFNFPYMDKRIEDGKKRPPDRMPKLLPCLAEQINALDTDLPLFIGGKSMGSRVGAILTSNEAVEQGLPEDITLTKVIKGTFCLGYPFHAIGKADKVRLSPVTNRSSDLLIVQGDRDKLGDKNEISGYSLPKHAIVKYLADGDHDLKPRVKSGFTHEQHIAAAIDHIVEYIDQRR